MTTLSVSVPAELREQMSKLDEVNWSAVARRAFEEKVKQIMLMKTIASKSKLTSEDAKKISDRISRRASARFLKLANEDRN